MAKKKNQNMPQSTAGLVNYYDSDTARFKIKPEHVLIVTSGIGGIVLALQFLV